MVECLLRDLFLAQLVSDFRLFGPEAFGGSVRVIGSAELGGRFRSGVLVVTSCVVVVLVVLSSCWEFWSRWEFWIGRLWQRFEVVVS